MGQTREQKIIKQLSSGTVQRKTAIATDMFLPNHSGDHSAGIVNSTPTKDTDLPNKKYVDDNAFSKLHADLTDVTTSQHHTKYTDAEAVSAVLADDKYLKNFENDTTTYKLTIGEVQVDDININNHTISTPGGAVNTSSEDIIIEPEKSGDSSPPGSNIPGADVYVIGGEAGGIGPGVGGNAIVQSGNGAVVGDTIIQTGNTGGNINLCSWCWWCWRSNPYQIRSNWWRCRDTIFTRRCRRDCSR